ncbi:MAG: hypothetical protein R6X34_00560, partial [Chloroflexota bacterium]
MQPIYRSDGEWVAVYDSGYLFNSDGEWIGFVHGREVFDTSGLYLGFLSDDRRLLRKRNIDKRPRKTPPPRPDRPNLPANMPLAPMLRALPRAGSLLDDFGVTRHRAQQHGPFGLVLGPDFKKAE